MKFRAPRSFTLVFFLTSAAVFASDMSAASDKADFGERPALRNIPVRPDDNLYKLALKYEHDGIPGDLDRAEMCYRQAAELGNARAQCELGVLSLFRSSPFFCYLPYQVTGPSLLAENNISAADGKIAAGWFRMAGAQNLPEAQYYLGAMLLYGKGVERDQEKAEMWLEKLHAEANAGVAEAQYFQAAVYEYKVGVAVPPNQNERIGWLRKAADQGLAAAQLRLSLEYIVGSTVSPNLPEAARLVRAAAEQGANEAEFRLGNQYRFGLCGVPKDMMKAVQWFCRAAEQGYYPAQRVLAAIYSTGEIGVSSNGVEAEKWRILADRQNITEVSTFPTRINLISPANR